MVFVKAGVEYVAKDKATPVIKKIDKRVDQMSKAIVSGGAAAGAAFVALGVRASALSGEVGKVANRLAATPEDISALGFAAREVGADIGAVESVMGDLAQRAVNTPKDFERWGISTTNLNGTLKSSTELMRGLADRVQEASSETERFALVDELASDEGRRLLPILRDGAEGLDRKARAAKDYGAVMSTASVIVGTDFTKAMSRFDSAVDGATVRIGKQMLPVFTLAFDEASRLIADTTKEAADSSDAFREIARVLVEGVAKGIAFVGQSALVLQSIWLSTKQAGLGLTSVFTDNSEEMRANSEEMERVSERMLTLEIAANKITAAVSGKKVADLEATQAERAKEDQTTRSTDALSKMERAMRAARQATRDLNRETDAVGPSLDVFSQIKQDRADAERAAIETFVGPTPDTLQAIAQDRVDAEKAVIEQRQALYEESQERLAQTAMQTRDTVAQAGFDMAGAFGTSMGDIVAGGDRGEQAVKRLAATAITSAGQVAAAAVKQAAAKKAAAAGEVVASGAATAASAAKKAEATALYPANIGLIIQAITTVTGLFASLATSFREGGVVTGPIQNSDSVPAFLMPGERVLTKRQEQGLDPLPAGLAARHGLSSGTQAQRGREGPVINLSVQSFVPQADSDFRRSLVGAFIPAASDLAEEGIEVRPDRIFGRSA